jgi:kinesin family protein 2/24
MVVEEIALHSDRNELTYVLNLMFFPWVQVDLTAYVEKHEFVFDAVLDQYVSNDEVYRTTVEPIVPTIFQRTKATCFAYGQTGKHDRTYLLHLIVPC